MVLVVATVLAPDLASGAAFDDLLAQVLATHDRILAAHSDVDAAEDRAVEAFSPLYPELDVTANYGWESQLKHEDAKTSTSFQEADLELTQLLWDFGASNAAIERARLELSESKATLVGVRQSLIEEAATAYADLLRARRVLAFARRSEANILDTTGLEEARVEAGGGLSTDVLQAKTQLAEAEARRIEADGTLILAENRFRAVFGAVPESMEAFDPIGVAEGVLPTSLEAALETAERHNTDLQLATLAEAVAMQDLRQTSREEFLPTVEAVASRKWKNNVSGTLGFKGETLAKVELSFPFNLGFTAVNTLRAAQFDHIAQTRRVGDTRRTVEEEVRNAWINLRTARMTVASRRTQADISAAFLTLARQERAYGQRSLIDVLSGETSLINALSETANAETDMINAAIALLRVTGQLRPDVFVSLPAPDDEIPSLDDKEESGPEPPPEDDLDVPPLPPALGEDG